MFSFTTSTSQAEIIQGYQQNAAAKETFEDGKPSHDGGEELPDASSLQGRAEAISSFTRDERCPFLCLCLYFDSIFILPLRKNLLQICVGLKRKVKIFVKFEVEFGIISHIRRCLTTEATQSLGHGLVTSRIYYCNALLHGLPAVFTNKLQRVQNAGTRLIIAKTRRFEHITPVLMELHWFPVKRRLVGLKDLAC